jgi:type II restriction enzyme
MPEPIDILENILLQDEPGLLEVLLFDHTTQKNIFWATDSYADYGKGYEWHDAITIQAITGSNGNIIMPRAMKSQDEQLRRSRQMAEVFTPSWLVKKMNNVIDEEWFSYQKEQNVEKKAWQNYILATRLEITCGEAPFLTSRYDTVSGKPIPVAERIGVLDRKLCMVNENSSDEKWAHWALLALGSVYGYEWQGDNLLLAREALLATFNEHHEQRFGARADKTILFKAAEIISWNVWQMDGLKAVVPCSCHEQQHTESDLFGVQTTTVTPCPGCDKNDLLLHNGLRCRLRRWLPSDCDMPDHFDCLYLDFITKNYKTHHKTKWPMKFDFVIGNPPYQEEKGDNGRQPPIYDKFMDGTYQVSDKILLISPARFLFNAGQTPKEWNKKMLSDLHLKVLMYEQDSSKVFPNTDIKGGVAVTYRNQNKSYGAIGVFTPILELNSILHKVKEKLDKSLAEIIYAPTKFDLDHLYERHPEFKPLIKAGGKDKLLRTNIFERLSVFHENKTSKDDFAILGLIGGKRSWRFIDKYYLDDGSGQINTWKVLLPESNGSGAIGEVLSTPLIGKPLIGYTQTFIGIGAFENEAEALALYKYIVGKFSRTMLGVLKITQHNPISTWKYVPLQDFTSSSDIDWSKSVHEIDLQLYDKYGLTIEERNFIETHVKEMA